MEREKIVSHYKFTKELGKGTYGVVYRAIDLNDQKIYAIKVIRTQVLKTGKNELQREIKALMDLRDHSNIVTIHEYFATINNHYLVLEYCSGGTLESKKDIGEEQTRRYLKQLLKALKALKQHKIIHRDLKPANIMLSDETPNAQIKVTDFGLARELQSSLSPTPGIGTPYYMAPEISNGSDRFIENSDIWSLGCILYELMTGRHLFDVGNDGQKLRSAIIKLETDDPENDRHGKPITLKRLLDGQPPAFADLMRGIIVVDPNKRLGLKGVIHHGFVYGYCQIEPIINRTRSLTIPDDYQLLTCEEAQGASEVLMSLAKDIPHPFLFHLKAMILLSPFIHEESCTEWFRMHYEASKECEFTTCWETLTMAEAIINKAIEMCKANVSRNLMKENDRQVLILLNCLKSTRYTEELKRFLENRLRRGLL